VRRCGRTWQDQLVNANGGSVVLYGVIMLGGLAHSNDLAGWAEVQAQGPDLNQAASWHSYYFNNVGC
jgi:hypothetical protein